MFVERTWRRVFACALLGGLTAGAAVAQPSADLEVVTELRVHGNYSIPDTEILALAAIAVGDRLEPGGELAIVGRLEASGQFERVEVRKRYTSLSQSDRIALILLVTERPAAGVANPALRTLARLSQQTMFVPVLRYNEGLGMTYGARFRLVDVLGDGGTVAIPVTFGGRREAALEVEKTLERGPLDRLRGGVSFARQENQHFRLNDRRGEAWIGADRALFPFVRVSADVRWSDIDFGGVDDRVTTYRGGVELDTRRNPGFPRDAVYVQAGWSWLDSRAAPAVIDRPELDARGYVRLIGKSVLAVRAQYVGASANLPGYAQPLLGGVGSVRGHRVGARAGDRLAVGSLELRLPISSPFSFGRAGLRAFVDTGAAFGVDQSIRKARFSRGVGGGLFLSAAIFTLQLDVAHDTVSRARVHVSTSVSF